MRLLLALALVIAAALCLWLFVFDGPGGSGRGTQHGDEASLLEGTISHPSSSTKDADGPVLFASGQRRTGPGALQGVVKWFGSGEPAAGMRVTATGTGRKREPIDASATTDAQGGFALSQVAATDELTVRVAAGTEHERIVLAVVEPGSVADLGVIWLGERGSITGRVTDAEGHPVEGATVAVHPSLGGWIELAGRFFDLFAKLDEVPKPDHETTTDAQGRFVVENVAPGIQVVVARAAGFAPVSKDVVKPAGTAPKPVHLMLPAGMRVHGVVVDAKGNGIADARVVAVHQADILKGLVARTLVATDGVGAFELTAPPGVDDDLALFVAARGYPSAFFDGEDIGKPLRLVLRRGTSVDLRVLMGTAGQPLGGAEVVMFCEGDDEGTKFALFALTDADGRAHLEAAPGKAQMVLVRHEEVGQAMFAPGGGGSVTVDDATFEAGENKCLVRVVVGTPLTGVVRTTEGEPIAGARVRVMAGLGGSGGDVVTGPDGAYTMVVQRDSVFGVLATAPGRVQSPESAMLDRSASKDADWVHDIVMVPAASVTGRVVAPDRTPVAGARVRFRDAGGDKGAAMAMAMTTVSVQEAISATNGRFVLDVSPKAKGRLAVRVPGYIDTGSDPVTLGEAGTTAVGDITLSKGRTLRVTVSDRSGDPVAGARLHFELDPEDEVQFDPMDFFGTDDEVTLTNAGGIARRPWVPPGSAVIIATASGWAQGRGTVSVPSEGDGPVAVSLELRPSAPVKGRVLDAEGAPLARARIHTVSDDDAEDDQWMPDVETTSDTDGSFVLEGLPHMPLTLEVGAQGHTTAKVQVIGANRDTLEVRLQARDPNVEAEIERLEARQQEILQKYIEAKGDKKKRLMKELGELSQEIARLRGDD